MNLGSVCCHGDLRLRANQNTPSKLLRRKVNNEMASKYRLNRYNWLGQKLLSQHKYDNILKLKQCLLLPVEKQVARSQARQHVSEYMIYLSSLALMQTNSSQLDEVIYSIQQLNFENNNQYFLLLCQCLLYLGNHESVIALCERVIAKEVSSSSTTTTTSDIQPTDVATKDTNKYEVLANDDYSPLVDSELKKLFQRVDANHLVAEPRLWFILGLCLEHQNRAKDALVAYKVSSNLALGAAQDDPTQEHNRHHHHHHHHYHRHSSSRALNSASLNNFHECHLKYAQLCVRLRGDHKRAAQVLSRAVARFPQNYTLNPLLSLISCSGPNSNMNHFNRALDMLQMLENHSATNRNPSASYNNLALRCQQRQQSIESSEMMTMTSQESSDYDSKFKLQYLLIKIHLQINSLVQDSSNWPNAFTIRPQPSSNSSHQSDKDKKLNQMIELMRSSDVSSWQSSSLWNNLAVCYLLRGKMIASLTCLLKAQQLDSLDWRISYNLALVSLQVGQTSRALCSLLAAKQLYESDQKWRPKDTKSYGSSLSKLITSLVSICFDRLNQVDEARRLHIEGTRSQSMDPFGKPLGTPILCIVNYLIYLHRSSAEAQRDPQIVKLKLHLLDLVEQLWLQRNQNDSQFNVHLLDIANKIGLRLNSENVIESGKARKTYAWTKVDGEKMMQNDDCDNVENV